MSDTPNVDYAVARAEERCKAKGLTGMEFWREMYADILLHARIAEAGTVCSRCGATSPHTMEECDANEQASLWVSSRSVNRAIKHLATVECSECARIVTLLNRVMRNKSQPQQGKE